MRNSLVILLLFILPGNLKAQSCIGFEQYFYTDKNGPQAIVPVIYFQDEHNLYVESHINYEQLHTLSIYAGKNFSGEKKFSYSATPMIGVVAGSLKGAVLALNAEINYKKISFTSQSQYFFSFQNNNAGFLFTWTDLYYRLIGKLFIGLSVQHTMPDNACMKFEPGLFTKVGVGNWYFPLYCFIPASENNYLILGVERNFICSVKKNKIMFL
jgi:hypothetical protein